jgi:hypothetical protein
MKENNKKDVEMGFILSGSWHDYTLKDIDLLY